MHGPDDSKRDAGGECRHPGTGIALTPRPFGSPKPSLAAQPGCAFAFQGRLGRTTDPDGDARGLSAASGSGSSTTTLPASPPGPGSIQATPIQGSPAYAVAEDGAIWIADHRDPQVDRLDPASGRIVASSRDDEQQEPFDHNMMLVPGVGGPWAWPFVIDSGRSVITHMSAATNTASVSAAVQMGVDAIGILGADTVADTASGLWGVGHGLGTADLHEIDRENGHVILATRIASTAADHTLVYAFGSLWLGGSGENVLYRIDPASGRLVSATTLPSWPVDLAGGSNVLYVAGADNSVARVDEATGCRHRADLCRGRNRPGR